MAKLFLWGSIGLFSAIGGYLPTLILKGDTVVASVLGSLVGGLFGIYVYVKLKNAGYVE